MNTSGLKLKYKTVLFIMLLYSKLVFLMENPTKVIQYGTSDIDIYGHHFFVQNDEEYIVSADSSCYELAAYSLKVTRT